MAKLYALLIILFLAALSLLAYFNKGVVEITLWKGHTYTIQVIALILLSTFSGILSTFIIIAIRDTRRYIDHWQIQRQEKKVAKIQELYTKGLDAFHAGRYDESSEILKKTIESDPSHVNALLRLGDISLHKDDLSEAAEMFGRAVKIQPRSVEVLFSLVMVCSADKRWKEALKYLDMVLEIDGDNLKSLLKKRDVYEATAQWEELIEVQQKVLKGRLTEEEKQTEGRNLTGFKYELGNHYLEKGATDNAIKVLKSIVKTDEAFYSAYLTLAEVYLKNGDTKEAEEILIRGYEATSSLVLLARLEDHLITMGEPGRTIDIYQKAIQKNQGDPRLQFFLAKLYYRLEMIDYALETAIAIDTAVFDSSELHALLGNIYERRAQHDRAVEELSRAVVVEKPLMMPFCCSNCTYTSKDWTGRCPQCMHWNTLTLDLDGTCKV